MRAFIAIDFSKKLKSEIAVFQAELKTLASLGRWKYINNFHLTIKFLGEISNERVNEISSKLDEICGRMDKFKLFLSEPGYFPGKDCMRVLWLSLDGELEKLSRLQNAIDIELESIGFKRENRPYIPHITIAQDVILDCGFDRVKNLYRTREFSEIDVDRIILFKSEQIENRRVYTPICEYSFKQG